MEQMPWTCLVLVGVAMVLPSYAAGLLCFSCSSVARMADCNNTVICPGNQHCFTESSGTVNQRRFTLGCRSEQECLLTHGAVSPSIVGRKRELPTDNCRQCCAIDRCNRQLCSDFDKIIVAANETCEDDPAFNCVGLSGLINICADVHHAKQVCRKWCGLCNLVDGAWSAWSTWSTCSVTCDNGHMTRKRMCNTPAPSHGGHDCLGNGTETISCHNRIPCPVSGGWGAWLPWETCSTTCGTGFRRRMRTCSAPTPANSGDYCPGENQEYGICRDASCEVHGGWSAWLPWEQCSATCGTGMRRRGRTCTDPAPSNNGRFCYGADEEYNLCNMTSCDRDGGWSAWGPWGNCSDICGDSLRSRSRACSNPYPKGRGRNCLGDVHSYKICHNYHQSCTPMTDNVRLVDGDHRSGRLEVMFNQTWGTVCNYWWDDSDTSVVCRMFGFSSGKAYNATQFGPGNGTIWMSQVSCTGSETSLFSCGFAGWGSAVKYWSDDCSHADDVGIECS